MAQEIADSKLLDTWGSSGTKIEPDITKIIEGWQLGEQPPHEYMNWLQNTFGSKLNHILKNGVAEWNNETEYLAGATTQHNGSVWKCKTTNTNSEPTDSNSNWDKMPSLENLALTVDTINDFPTSATTGDTCIVKDLDRGGIFIYDSTKVDEDNQGTNFSGWIRQFSGAVNVKWFGSDYNALANAVATGENVFIDGTLVVTSNGTPIQLHSNQTIFGGKIVSISNSENNGYLFIGNGISNVSFVDLHFSTPNRHRLAWFTNVCSNLNIENCKLENTSLNGYSAFGIAFGITGEDTVERSNITVNNSIFINMCGSASLKFAGCENVTISNNVFTQNLILADANNYPNYPCQIDLEVGNDASISNCVFYVPNSNGNGDSKAYGIYQGDGEFNRLSITGSVFSGRGINGISHGIKIGGGSKSSDITIDANIITECQIGVSLEYASKCVISNNHIDDSTVYSVGLVYGSGGMIVGNRLSTNSSATGHTIMIGENSSFPLLGKITINCNYIKQETNSGSRYCIGLYTYHDDIVVSGNTFDMASTSNKFIADINTGTSITQSNAITYGVILTNDKDNKKIVAGSLVDDKFGLLIGANAGYQTGYSTSYSYDGNLGTAKIELVCNQATINSLVGECAITNASSGYSGRLIAALRGYTGAGSTSKSKVMLVGMNDNGVEHSVNLDYNHRFIPSSDNVIKLGDSSNRWSVIYAGTGTINTSDERLKTFFDIEQAEIDCAKECKTLIRKFKFNDSIDKKGDTARYHFGVGAQTIKSTFEKHSLDPEMYGILCYDKWEDKYETVVITPAVEAKDAVFDDEGNVVEEAIEAVAEVTEERLVLAGGDRYGIRYDELFMFILAGI